jgi:hypothetical protein
VKKSISTLIQYALALIINFIIYALILYITTETVHEEKIPQFNVSKFKSSNIFDSNSIEFKKISFENASTFIKNYDDCTHNNLSHLFCFKLHLLKSLNQDERKDNNNFLNYSDD